MWFFETVLALLEGEEETEYERRRWVRKEQSLAEMTVSSWTAAQPHRPQLNGRPSAMHVSGGRP